MSNDPLIDALNSILQSARSIAARGKGKVVLATDYNRLVAGLAALTLPTPRSLHITLTAAGQINSAYPAGNPPSPVWAAIPNFLARTTSLSVNIQTTYLTPTAGAVVTLVSGSLPSGWTFDGTTLTYDGTTVNGSVSTFAFSATYLGVTAVSNTVRVQGLGSPSTDTLAPTVPTGLSATVTPTAITLSWDNPIDPRVAGVNTGVKDTRLYKDGSGTALTTVNALPGKNSDFAFLQIGTPPVASSATQASPAGGNWTLVAGGNVTGTSDDQSLITDANKVSGDYTITFWVDTLTGPNPYSRVGPQFRDTNAANSAYVALVVTPATNPAFPGLSPAGLSLDRRPSAGAAQEQVAAVPAITVPVCLQLTRNATTGVFSAAYSTTGNNFIAIGSTTVPMNTSVYAAAMGHGRDDAGLAPLTATIRDLCVNNVARLTYTDTTTGSHTYSVDARDLAGTPNVSAKSATITAATTSASQIKWTTGFLMDSGFFHGWGNKDTFDFSDATARRNAEIDDMRASAADSRVNGHLIGYTLYLFWRAFTNPTQGSYDFSIIDSAWTRCTGWNGSTYNNPRMLGIYCPHSDYFGTNPATRAVPGYVLSNSAYGAGPTYASPGNNGWWTSTGYSGEGTGASAANWRSAVTQAMITDYTAMANHILPDGTTVDANPYVLYQCPLLETAASSQSPAGQGPDSSYSPTGYVSQLLALADGLKTAFSHTNFKIPTNFTGPDGTNEVTLAAGLPSRRAGWSGPDVFGKTSGTNINPSGGLRGLTWGQAAACGLVPPGGGANPYFTPWVGGGTDIRDQVPGIATIQGTELTTQFGNFYTPQDCIDQANDTLHSGIISIAYLQGRPEASANWFGSHSTIGTWNGSEGVLGAIAQKTITHTTKPTSYP